GSSRRPRSYALQIPEVLHQQVFRTGQVSRRADLDAGDTRALVDRALDGDGVLERRAGQVRQLSVDRLAEEPQRRAGERVFRVVVEHPCDPSVLDADGRAAGSRGRTLANRDAAVVVSRGDEEPPDVSLSEEGVGADDEVR